MEVTEAPSVHRAMELVCQFYQQFIYKAFTSKLLSRICTLYLRRSLCRRYLRDIALPPSLRYSVCLLDKTFSLSLHISEERKNVYYQSYQQYMQYTSVALCAFGTSVILSVCFHLRVLPSLCAFYMQQAYFITPYFGRSKINRKVFTLLSIFSKKNTFKTKFSSGFINTQQSVAYKAINLKVLNWTSKGRQLDLKRASFASQKGVFSKPIKHHLNFKRLKIIYKPMRVDKWISK